MDYGCITDWSCSPPTPLSAVPLTSQPSMGRSPFKFLPGSSSGRLLRLRGRGLEWDGRLGDQLVEIVVVIPADLGDAERALYRRLQELALEERSAL